MSKIILDSFLVFFIFVFGFSAYSKFKDLEVFKGVVLNFKILPNDWANSFAVLLPFIELAAALLVLFEDTRKIGALLILLLLVSFTVAIVINLLRGRSYIDCGCFKSNLSQQLSFLYRRKKHTDVIFCTIYFFKTGSNDGMSFSYNLYSLIAGITLFVFYLSSGILSLPNLKTYEENYNISVANSNSVNQLKRGV